MTAAETLREPTLEDVEAARVRIRPYLAPTPLRRTAALERLIGAEVWVKHENLMPTGAFKVRGGINLMAQLDAGVRARGVVAASTGNHGQSVAYAARLFGTTAIICAPENANPVKVEGMRDLGAMNRGEMDSTGRGSTKAGMICGIIGTVLCVLEILCGAAMLILWLVAGIGLTAAGGAGSGGPR